MLGHNALSEQALCGVVAGTPTPYAIEIDDATEIDKVTLVIVEAFIDPDQEA
jgi:hypothetical protein